MFNLGVGNKLFYEALHRFLMGKFEESVNVIDNQILMYKMYENLSTLKDKNFTVLYMFRGFKDDLLQMVRLLQNTR